VPAARRRDAAATSERNSPNSANPAAEFSGPASCLLRMLQEGRRIGVKAGKEQMMNVTFTLRGIELTPEQREILNRKAEFSFDRFSDKLASVEILLDDMNGPRGGDDKRCRVILRLHHEPTVILEERGAVAIAVGLTAIERAARRIAEKRPRWKDHRAAMPPKLP
jgi:hypothetical protein